MKNKPGAALVEMGDYYAADRAITHLNNTFLFSQRINLWWALCLHDWLMILIIWLYDVTQFRHANPSFPTVYPSSLPFALVTAMSWRTAQAVTRTSTAPGTIASRSVKRRIKFAFNIPATSFTSSTPHQTSPRRFSRRCVDEGVLPKQTPAGSIHFRCNSWKTGRKKIILISDLQLCLALDRFVRRLAWSLLLMSTSLQERVSWFCHVFHFCFTATHS